MRNKLRWGCLFLLMASCKYEDGPLISFTSIPNRISGAYYLESVTVSGEDETAQMDTLHIAYFHFDTNRPEVGGEGSFWVAYTDTTTEIHSSWSLHLPEKKYIEFGVVSGKFAPLPGFFFNPSDNPWKILKLSNHRFWIEINYNGDEIEVHLKEP